MKTRSCFLWTLGMNMTHVDLSRLRTDGGWSKKRRSLRLIHLFIYQINIVECVCITVAVWNCWFGSPRCRNLHTWGCFWCNYLQSPPPPVIRSAKATACSDSHLHLLLKGVPSGPGNIRPGNHQVSWLAQLVCSPEPEESTNTWGT